jgi:hypothetical protein
MLSTAQYSESTHNPYKSFVSDRFQREEIIHDRDERELDFSAKFLPDTLSKINEIDFLSSAQRRFLSQIQGRTYANMLLWLERRVAHTTTNDSHNETAFVGRPKESRDKVVALESTDQTLFQCIDVMINRRMPSGYRFVLRDENVTMPVLPLSKWARLALAFHINLLTQAHYKQSAGDDAEISEFFKNMFLHHWRNESRSAIVNGIEWAREDAELTDALRSNAVDELIRFIDQLDDVLDCQANADVEYFIRFSGQPFGEVRRERMLNAILSAYRWQYIGFGLRSSRFVNTLVAFIEKPEYRRFCRATSYVTNSIKH